MKYQILFCLLFGLSFLPCHQSQAQTDVKLNFPNNNIHDVLAVYQKLTGKTVIAQKSVTEDVMMRLSTANSVPKIEAIQLIEAAIKNIGIQMEPTADGKAVKLSLESPFRHAVFFKFKEDASKEEIKEIEAAFVALKDKIDTIVDFEWGPSESVEGLNDEFTHCFFVTFKDKAGLEKYIPHQDHKAFVDLLKPKLDKVFVFDYTAR